MKIDVCSDLHLEFNWSDETEDDQFDVNSLITKDDRGDILVIAGDICPIGYSNLKTEVEREAVSVRLRKFFDYAKSQYKHVLYVLGNHDYWKSGLSIANKTYEEVTGIKPLNNSAVEIGDYIFVGGTLWTDIKDVYDQISARKRMNDYRMIYSYRNMDNIFETIDPKDTNKEYTKTLKYIKKVIKDHPDKKIVVVTHHAPLYECAFMHIGVDNVRDNKIKHAKELKTGHMTSYCNMLDDFIHDNPNIVAWIHGHAHESVSWDYGNCKIIANPRGYWIYEYQAYEYKLKTFEV